MLRYIILSMFALFASGVLAQTTDPDRAADPPFAGERYKPSNSPPETSPQPVATHEPGRLSYELVGFTKGDPFHPRMRSFTDIVTRDVNLRIGREAQRIERIVVTGFADGLPNSGITRHALQSFPPRCREGVSVPIDDDELAVLRGCIVMQALKPRIAQRFAGGATWRSEFVNIKDGGDAGDPYRKVTILIILEASK